MIARAIFYIVAIGLTAGFMIQFVELAQVSSTKRLTVSWQSDGWKNRYDYTQKPTPWDKAVQDACADYAHRRHVARGGGGHPMLSAHWMNDIRKCQKRLGFMAKRARI